MAVSKRWCELEIDTNQKDLNLVFANHGEEDKKFPLATIEIAKAQKEDQELRIYYRQKTETPKKDECFQLIKDTIALCRDDKFIIPASIRHRAVLVSPLSPAPWPLTSQRDNEICDVLERYAQYYLVKHQILQIVPNKQETQTEVWSGTTKASRKDSLASFMCRPHRAIHS
jgi:hypothetical protein